MFLFRPPDIKKLQDKMEITKLYKIARDPGWGKTCIKAIDALGKLYAEDQLIQLLSDEKGFQLLPNRLDERVIWNLANLRSRKAVEPLISRLYHHSADAGEALGWIGDPRAVVPLLEMSLTPASSGYGFDGAMSGAAHKGLPQIGEAAIQPLINELRTKGKKREYYSTAMNALAKIGIATVIPLSDALESSDKEFLIRVITTLNDVIVRNNDVQMKAHISNRFLHIIEHEDDDHMRALLSISLGQLGAKEAIPFLTEIVNDKGGNFGLSHGLVDYGETITDRATRLLHSLEQK